MARVHIPSENRVLDQVDQIRSFLEPHGIWYEHWEVEGRLPQNPTDAQILETYQAEIDRLKSAGGFVTADVINVRPETPNLDAMLEKFNKEHTHDEDEVRFTVSGRGLFHIHPESGPVFAVEVSTGDLINVPRGTKHWFHLCDDRHIRCIRLFQDPTGWTPHYIQEGVHSQYQPICFGPGYVDGSKRVAPVIPL
ncbi:MAG: 1,2-dihydroxy-3-keto-5-methylthiopentene dioxygenase [Pirellulaceae bacterium]|jgi:1,2-dihydroxy-3-keto-5-methylthiopentene dioxygenase